MSLSTSNENVLLERLIDEVHQINQKLGKLLSTQEDFLQKLTNEEWDNKFKLNPDVMTLLSLPSALRKTVIALYKLEKATANELSNETKRLRAVESASANQLVRMGLLSKKREGRKVYFTLSELETWE